MDKQIYHGLVINDRMKWISHTHGLCDKLRAILAKFSVIRNKILFPIKLLLYKILGEPTNLILNTYINSNKNPKKIIPPKIKEKCNDNYTGLFAFCRILPIFLNTDLQI